jgi:oligopeptide transport system substrate-binding protein
MLKKKVVLAAVTLGSVAVLAGCGGSKQSASKQQSFKIMESDVIQTMDPALATDIISGQTMLNTYAGLYRYDGKKLKPDMAAKMAKVTNNNLTYTFTLRKGAKWSDGKTVTAQDFAYAWKRAVDPATKS